MTKHLLLSKLRSFNAFKITGYSYGEGWRDGSGECFSQDCGENLFNEYGHLFNSDGRCPPIMFYSSTLLEIEYLEFHFNTKLTE
jgi:hypothetical protein